MRVLPHVGDEKRLTLAAGQDLKGSCDVAVRVHAVAYDAGTVRFGLTTVGLPRAGERRASCKRLEPEIALALTGVAAGPLTADSIARIDRLLLGPEAFLRARGGAFERVEAGPPAEVASQLPDASEAERRLARGVVAWPRRLLSFDAVYRDPAGGPRHERLVALEAIVGSDGRLYQPRLKLSIDPAHDAAIQATLPLWRFEPARRSAEGAVGARVALETALRVY